jgi:hypothetical protein
MKNRTRLLAAAVALCLFSGIAFYFFPRPPAPPPHPRLEADVWHQDLGVLATNETAPLEFRLRNAGASDLVITEFRTSCGCSPAALDRTVIPGGESASVTVKLRMPNEAGPVAHTVFFSTNDPDHTEARLSFQATAVRPIDATPPNIYVGTVKAGGSVTHDVELCTADASPLAVEAVVPSSPRVRTERLPDPAAHRRLFRVTVEGGREPGAIAESVTFLTNVPKQKQVIVPIRGESVIGGQVVPTNLMLKSCHPGGTAEAGVLVSATGGPLPRIDAVTVRDPAWKVLSWSDPKIDGTSYALRVTLRVPQEPGYKRTTLVLSDTKSGHTAEVQISCLVKSADRAGD